MDVNYMGEFLLPGQIGHFLTILSTVAAFLATIGFFIAGKKEKIQPNISQSWKKLGRTSFSIHAFSVFGIIALLFYLILTHRFEYKYVWQHSSIELPIRFMLSCFWEGQEGSFLLWSFWTVVLGLVLMKIAKKWEASVMTSISLMQIFLSAMLVGIYVFDYQIGSSPFILLRDTQAIVRADYLFFVRDGNGLNILLQNYWMVIHPPTLFLGFASCIVPFAYVIAGLWKKEFNRDWVKPTLNWSLFAAAILGTGILMGGAWAYEALSFGGFWAWDPVENASLVPWIVLIGGIHTLVAYKHSGHALRASAVFLVLSFMLILYSTFLTRSGVLGDTSVHAFTDLGMSGQLLVFMLSFLALAVFMLAKDWKTMPSPKKEESAYSREFWMFVGALIMLMLSILIAIDTSWPVINDILGTKIAIEDAVSHYNRYAIWFGIVIALLSAVIQYFRYKNSNTRKVIRQLSIATILTVIFTGLIAYSMSITSWMYVLFLFAALYVTIANFNYVILVLSGKVKVAGGPVAHIGFGIILLGVLFSCGKKEVISANNLGVNFQEMGQQESMENILLYKGEPAQMNDYWVTYVSDKSDTTKNGTSNTITSHYELRFEKKKNREDEPSEIFTLHPNVLVQLKNNGEGDPDTIFSANPYTRHYWHKDVFTHITQVPKKSASDTTYTAQMELAIGESRFTNKISIELNKINPSPTNPDYQKQEGDIPAGAQISIKSLDKERETVVHNIEPVYYIRENTEYFVPVKIEELGLTVSFDKVIPEQNKIQVTLSSEQKAMDYLVMKAIVFPFISVLWLGCFVMVIGFFISIVHHFKQGKRWAARANRANKNGRLSPSANVALAGDLKE